MPLSCLGCHVCILVCQSISVWLFSHWLWYLETVHMYCTCSCGMFFKVIFLESSHPFIFYMYDLLHDKYRALYLQVSGSYKTPSFDTRICTGTVYLGVNECLQFNVHSLTVNQSEKDFNGGRTKNDWSPPMLYFSTPNLVSVQLIRSFSVLRYFLGWRLVTCIFVCVCWGQSASIHAVRFRI